MKLWKSAGAAALIFVVLLAGVANPVRAAEPAMYKGGGIAFSVPQAWTSQTPDSRMRLFQFQIPSPGEGFEGATMSVFYFGQGMGGGVEANVERWKSEFTSTDPDFPPVTQVFDVNGMKVTLVQIEGVFQSGMPGEARIPKKDWAVGGAIVEGPQGLVFFKITGPVVTVRAARIPFGILINNIRPETAAA